MYSKPISFSVAFTDKEESIIGPILEKHIKGLATRDFFMDIYTDGDVMIVLNIIKRMRNNYTVVLDKAEILTLIGILRDQPKMTEDLQQIVDCLASMVDHSFFT
jgi:hypothetical protein